MSAGTDIPLLLQHVDARAGGPQQRMAARATRRLCNLALTTGHVAGEDAVNVGAEVTRQLHRVAHRVAVGLIMVIIVMIVHIIIVVNVVVVVFVIIQQVAQLVNNRLGLLRHDAAEATETEV